MRISRISSFHFHFLPDYNEGIPKQVWDVYILLLYSEHTSLQSSEFNFGIFPLLTNIHDTKLYTFNRSFTLNS